MKRVSIDQFSPSVLPRDGIGNEVVALQKIFRELGYRSRIFAEEQHTFPGCRIHDWRRYHASRRDLLLVHYTCGSPAYESLFSLPQCRFLLYHAPTPENFLRDQHPSLPQKSVQASRELPCYSGSVDVALAHSRFTAADLESAGYRNVRVFPYLADERLYQEAPDKEILARFQGDGWRNLLAVGRITPNKSLEDCLFILDYLKRYVERRWRLFLVGRWTGTETYQERLQRLAKRMGLQDVVFTGPVSQCSLLAYYRIADALLFMSEHEGFGVPLVEGMNMDVPVIAHAATAVPEVLGDAGVLFKTKDCPLMAETIALLSSDLSARESVLTRQRERREVFVAKRVARQWSRLIEQAL